LPEFAGQNRTGVAASAELIAFVVKQYANGRSLREIAELTDRTHGAVRNILDRAGVPRRSRGAEKAAMPGSSCPPAAPPVNDLLNTRERVSEVGSKRPDVNESLLERSDSVGDALRLPAHHQSSATVDGDPPAS
jgi:transcription initiation factor TFIIIB Brf1 subunit/transcription initiation factor TFIIB